MTKVDSSKLDGFNAIIDARDAVDMCITLASYWQKKTAWDSGVKQWLVDSVFSVAGKATPSDEITE